VNLFFPDKKNAKIYYEIAVEKKQKRWYSSLANCYRNEKDIRIAMDVVLKEINDFNTCETLKWIEYEMKKYLSEEEYLNFFTKIIDVDSEYANEKLGIYYHEKNNVQKAIEYLEKCESSFCKFQLADIYSSIDIDKMIKYYEECCAFGHKNIAICVQAHHKLVEYYQKNDNQSKSVDLCQQLIKITNNPKAHTILGKWFLGHNIESSLRHFEIAIKMGDIMAKIFLGDHYRYLGNDEKMIEYYPKHISQEYDEYYWKYTPIDEFYDVDFDHIENSLLQTTKYFKEKGNLEAYNKFKIQCEKWIGELTD